MHFPRRRDGRLWLRWPPRPVHILALLGVAAYAALFGAAVHGAVAPHPTIRGNVRGQPAVKFPIGPAGAGPVSAVVAGNGTAYIAYTAPGPRQIRTAYLCVLPLGAQRCARTTALAPPGASGGVASQPDSVLFSRGRNIDVLVTMARSAGRQDRAANGLRADTLEFVLSRKGLLIGAPARVGTLEQQGNAIGVGNRVLWTSGTGTYHGAAIDESPPAGKAFPHLARPKRINLAHTPASGEKTFHGVDGVALPNGDLLLAWDDGTNAYSAVLSTRHRDRVIHLRELPGAITTAAVGAASDSLASGPSGTYLVTRSVGSACKRLLIRRYAGNGRFAPAHRVPGAGAGCKAVTVDEDRSGVVHVFYKTLLNNLVEDSSANGRTGWTTQTYPQEAPVGPGNIAPALTRFGAGVVAEAAVSGPGGGRLLLVQPVLAHQTVTLHLAPAAIAASGRAIASGRVTYPDAGQLVSLQRHTGQGWVTVQTGRTNSVGGYSFVIAGQPAGPASYRVEAHLVQGWFYGDVSPVAGLRVGT